MSDIDALKKQRMEEKATEYKMKGWNPNPDAYPLKVLVSHFLAEVGKFMHRYYHWKGNLNESDVKEAFADVSNLHDMILNRIREKRR